MHDDIVQLLTSLRLGKIADIYEEEVTLAQRDETSYDAFLARLLRAQWHANQEGALNWRIKRAMTAMLSKLSHT